MSYLFIQHKRVSLFNSSYLPFFFYIQYNSIPPQLRAQTWKIISGGEALKQSQSPDVYRKLLQMPLDKKVEHYIIVDLPRTFVLRSAFERTTAFRKSLYNILKSYAVLDPALGYCQGMSFIVAFLFQILDEEDTFWVFASIMQKYSLSGIYKGNLSLLQFFLYCTDRYAFCSRYNLSLYHLQTR